MRLLVLLLLTILAVPALAQPSPQVFEVVEQMPELYGGLEGLQERLAYPAACRDAGAEGRVFIQFVVGTRGYVLRRGPNAPRVARGIHPACDEAILEAVRGLTFQPGLQGGEPVPVRFALPVTFRLDGGLVPEEEVIAPVDPGMDPPPPPSAPPEIFDIIEQMPEPIGGLEGIQQRTVYPEACGADGVEGRVFVQFVVTEVGRVEDARVSRGIHLACDAEALRVVRESRFTPGTQRGEPIRVRFSLPVTFRLN